MVQIKSQDKRLLIAAALSLVVSGVIAIAGSFGEAVVVIRNETAFDLTNVEIGGDGGEFETWTQSVADIPAGDTVSVRVTESRGESGLRIRLEANGDEIAKSDIAYLMNGGRGTTTEIVIDKNGRPEASHYSWPSWHWRRIVSQADATDGGSPRRCSANPLA